MSAMDLGSPKPAGSRRLAAVLAADIKGYSALMGIDEDGTVARVTRQFEALADPTVRQHGGRIFKTMGDGFLAIFDSPLDATRCALAFQKAAAEENIGLPTERWLRYRIGINLGDVIAAADDVYGDSVNIAARLQTLAEPGGICISGSVHDQIRNKLGGGFLSLGEERLKNIVGPVRVFRVLPDAGVLARAKLIRPRRVAAAIVLLLLAGATGWWAWASLVAHEPGGSREAASLSITSGPTGSQAQPIAADPHREVIFQRMVAVMSDNRFSWRTLERVALEAGVTEAEAHDILAAHARDVTLGKSKDGKLIVRLADR
jgi:class 3 adenylate cyclase